MVDLAARAGGRFQSLRVLRLRRRQKLASGSTPRIAGKGARMALSRLFSFLARVYAVVEIIPRQHGSGWS